MPATFLQWGAVVKNKYRACVLTILASVLVACSNEAPEEVSPVSPAHGPGSLEQGLATINRGGIEAHLEYLADDALMGRFPGTPGYDDAAAYVAERFAEIGLEPGGEDGWYQQVSLLARQIDVKSAKFVFHQDDVETEQRWKEDFVMEGDKMRPETSITAEVVFVGFGVHAPEMNYSDYDGIDVNGKIVAVFGGAPASFPRASALSMRSGLASAYVSNCVRAALSSATRSSASATLRALPINVTPRW